MLQGNHVTDHHLREDVGFVPDPGLDSVVLGYQVNSSSTDLAARFDELRLKVMDAARLFVYLPILDVFSSNDIKALCVQFMD